jgi:signal transduction histidine kinase
MIAQGAGQTLDYVGSLIAIPDAAGERLIMGAVWGSRFMDAALKFTGLEVASFSLPLTAEENPIAQAYLNSEIQAWSQTPERIVVGIEPVISPKLAPAIQRAMGARLAACVPLPVGDKVVGVLIVFSPREQLSDEERVMLLGLADQAGLAIENVQLLDATQKHREELQSLSAQLINAQEAERIRISRELHDQMGQALTAMSINLAAVEKELPPEVAPTTRERLAETHWLADRTLEQVRQLSFDLRPSMLDDLGLVPTLRWYVNRYAQMLNIEAEFEAMDLEERLPAEMETVLYRVAQEALTNIARHAEANKVHIRLERKKAQVRAFIEDDGQGFDVKEVAGRQVPERGMGLLGMRERVASLGGKFSIRSRPGRGTRLTIEIPI